MPDAAAAASDIAQTFGMGRTGEALDQLCVDTIKTLSIDGVEAANSGHPGMPMGMADAAYVLWTEFLNVDPEDPRWPGRDRFILSAGHGSMLLYSLLHLSGFELRLDELKQFRQLGSRTPGHPESYMTPGVETTTGPLGQGFANGVGMALAERHLAARYGEQPSGHRVFAICSDGDLMEGVASEAASLAGHLKLGRLVYLYDDNKITIDGSTDLAFTEDVCKRFEAYGWRTERVDGHDRAQVRAALARATAQVEKPTLIACRTRIGKGSATKEGSHDAHGAPLGKDDVRKTKEKMGWPLEPTFLVPEAVRERFALRRSEWRKTRDAWNARVEAWKKQDADKHGQWKRALEGRVPDDLAAKLPVFDPAKDAMATRAASGKTINALASVIPTLIGGSADLAGSNNTEIKNGGFLQASNYAGRNISFGVREHAMGSLMNGMALHGGVIPFGGTFLIFSDYMRPAMRLAALCHLRVIYVLTHDSVFLGEDGPTHQPIEHLTALAAIPNLTVIRPGDPNETAWAWKVALERTKGPTALCLTRQKLPCFDRSKDLAPVSNVERGGYTFWESAPGQQPELILLATGSELALALDAGKKLAAEDKKRVRVVSMPAFDLYDAQPKEYRDAVLPPKVWARVSIEAGRTFGWAEYVGDLGMSIGIDRFGESAPDKALAEKFGLTVPQVVAKTRAYLADLPKRIAERGR